MLLLLHAFCNYLIQKIKIIDFRNIIDKHLHKQENKN